MIASAAETRVALDRFIEDVRRQVSRASGAEREEKHALLAGLVGVRERFDRLIDGGEARH